MQSPLLFGLLFNRLTNQSIGEGERDVGESKEGGEDETYRPGPLRRRSRTCGASLAGSAHQTAHMTGTDLPLILILRGEEEKGRKKRRLKRSQQKRITKEKRRGF